MMAVVSMLYTASAYDKLREQDFQFNNFTQKLDHFNFTMRNANFTQRYWVND